MQHPLLPRVQDRPREARAVSRIGIYIAITITFTSSRCPGESSHCVTIVRYTPNLQDDSDANYDDQAGRMIKMERGCSKVG